MKAYNNKMHEGRVMGLYYDAQTSLIYSIGEDKKFKVYDLTRNYVICGKREYIILSFRYHSQFVTFDLLECRRRK